MRLLPQPGADLEKYLWGGERGSGIFEGWQNMADVYILNLITVKLAITFNSLLPIGMGIVKVLMVLLLLPILLIDPVL